MNLLMASAIITSEYIKGKSGNMVVDATVSISIKAIIAAQQAAMIAAYCFYNSIYKYIYIKDY